MDLSVYIQLTMLLVMTLFHEEAYSIVETVLKIKVKQTTPYMVWGSNSKLKWHYWFSFAFQKVQWKFRSSFASPVNKIWVSPFALFKYTVLLLYSSAHTCLDDSEGNLKRDDSFTICDYIVKNCKVGRYNSTTIKLTAIRINLVG